MRQTVVEALPDERFITGDALEQAGDYTAAAAAYGDAARSADSVVRGEACFRLGRLSWRQTRHDEALRHYDAARAIAQAGALEELLARVENGVGAVHYALGELAQARACYLVALERSRAPGQKAKVLLNLGVIANIQGDYDGALQHYQRSRDAFAADGDFANEALVLHNLGMLNADLERWDEADEAYADCLALSERSGNLQLIANALVNRSEVLCGRQRYEEALALCDRAMALYRDLGDEVGRSEALRRKGAAYRRAARGADAERALGEAARSAARLRNPLIEAEAALELGLLHAERRQAAAARRWLERAIRGFTKLGAARDLAAAEEALAGLSAPRGD